MSLPATDVGIFIDVKKEILNYLQEEKTKGNLYDYSFYFRDLSSGLWFGDHEATSFFPASLFKLPIAIATYKQGEEDLSFLKRQIVFTKELAKINEDVTANEKSNLVIGQTYSVESLIEIMLEQSDNGAKNAIVSVLNMKYLDQLFKLTTFVETTATEAYSISSRKYALFLRVLYSSSYINEEHSEKILSMLVKSSFKEGLVAGVPKNVSVAHKFGVYQFLEKINGKEQSIVQLHDCGIIYYEISPYVLCFMSKGKSPQELFTIISNVSKIIYKNQEYEGRQ